MINERAYKLPILPEAIIQKTILEYLHIKGHYCWRNNTGAFEDKRGKFYRFGKKGSADIIGCSKEGKAIAIEVKRRGAKPTAEQCDFLNKIRVRGGHGILAYTVDDVIKDGL